MKYCHACTFLLSRRMTLFKTTSSASKWCQNRLTRRGQTKESDQAVRQFMSVQNLHTKSKRKFQNTKRPKTVRQMIMNHYPKQHHWPATVGRHISCEKYNNPPYRLITNDADLVFDGWNSGMESCRSEDPDISRWWNKPLSWIGGRLLSGGGGQATKTLKKNP